MSRPHTRAVLVALALASVLLVACGGAARPVRVLAASSLVDVVPALAAAAGVDVVVSDAGSQVLQAQVAAGADADLVLLADPARAAALWQQGAALAPVAIAGNGLAIVLADGVTDVGRPADLAHRRVVLADTGVPLGDATRAALAREGEDVATAVLAATVSFEDAARVVLAKVRLGEAEAAVVYRTDAAIAPELTVVPWPDETDVSVSYTAQALPGASDEAAALLDFLASPAARAVWERFGFTAPVTPS